MVIATTGRLVQVFASPVLVLLGTISCLRDATIEGSAAWSEVDPPGACGRQGDCAPEQCGGTPSFPNCQGLAGLVTTNTCSSCGERESYRVHVVGGAYELQSCSPDSGGIYDTVETLPAEKVVEACESDPAIVQVVCASQPNDTAFAGGRCCGGAFANVDTDPRHCGACANDCGVDVCVGGRCVPGAGEDDHEQGSQEQPEEDHESDDAGDGDDREDGNDRGGSDDGAGDGGGGGGGDPDGSGGTDPNGNLCGDICENACTADASGEPCDEAHMRCMRLHDGDIQRCQADGTWTTWWVSGPGLGCCQALADEVQSCIQNEDYIPDEC